MQHDFELACIHSTKNNYLRSIYSPAEKDESQKASLENMVMFLCEEKQFRWLMGYRQFLTTQPDLETSFACRISGDAAFPIVLFSCSYSSLASLRVLMSQRLHAPHPALSLSQDDISFSLMASRGFSISTCLGDFSFSMLR